MEIKTNNENKIYLYKREGCVTRSLDPKNDPSGQASWSEFDPAYSVQIFRQVTEAVPKQHFLWKKV